MNIKPLILLCVFQFLCTALLTFEIKSRTDDGQINQKVTNYLLENDYYVFNKYEILFKDNVTNTYVTTKVGYQLDSTKNIFNKMGCTLISLSYGGNGEPDFVNLVYSKPLNTK